MTNTLRLFISLNIRQQIRNALNHRISILQQKGFDEIRWTKPQKIHLTLQFLGNVHKSLVCKINAQLSQIATSVQPFVVGLSNIGLFPHAENPRIVWIGIRENMKTLDKLRSLSELKLSTLGIASEKNSYKPHLTLGRVNRNTMISANRLTALMQELTCGHLKLEWKIQELHLIHSRPTSNRFAYRNIGIFRLGRK
ncbi:MAG TPA: RNA 2',3'-cyclic phosphodiesterase [Deltaproteobacteria bacterium]|nr:RNA 2',3'-cyclic phosphodiesterase [Deltaproteobacteria bacterium]